MSDKEEVLKERIARAKNAEDILRNPVHEAAWRTIERKLRREYENQDFDPKGTEQAEYRRMMLRAFYEVQSLYVKAVRDGEHATTALQKLKRALRLAS